MSGQRPGESYADYCNRLDLEVELSPYTQAARLLWEIDFGARDSR